MQNDRKATGPSGAGSNMPQSYDEAMKLVSKGREDRGKPKQHREEARAIVERLMPIILEMQARGDFQEDAVILAIEVSGDPHKPDTIRKAIRAAVGRWTASLSPADHTGAMKASSAREEAGSSDPHHTFVSAENPDDQDGGLVL